MWITADDLERGSKRINVTLDIKACQKLATLSEERGSIFPGTLAKMYLTDMIIQEYKKYQVKNHELPGQQNLFSKNKNKKGKKDR